MTAFSPTFLHWSRIRISSFFWTSTERPRFDGQSMLATVATQTARNSRGGSGIVSPPPTNNAANRLKNTEVAPYGLRISVTVAVFVRAYGCLAHVPWDSAESR